MVLTGSIDTAEPLECTSARVGIRREPTSEDFRLLIENKYVAIAALVGFLLTLWLTDGSLFAAFGVLALISGIGWAARRLLR